MKKKCGCTGRDKCDDCKPHEQLEFWKRDRSYLHVTGLDQGWDPDKGRLEWARTMKSAEIRKYLIKCECEQCKACHRKFRYGWIEIDALWCIEARYAYGFRCPYCWHHFADWAQMSAEIEDLGEPSEEEIERIGLKPESFVGLEDEGCFGNA